MNKIKLFTIITFPASSDSNRNRNRKPNMHVDSANAACIPYPVRSTDVPCRRPIHPKRSAMLKVRNDEYKLLYIKNALSCVLKGI